MSRSLRAAHLCLVGRQITAVQNARMAESPLLLLGGAAATLLKGRGSLQDIEQLPLLRTICKYTKTVTRVADIVPVCVCVCVFLSLCPPRP